MWFAPVRLKRFLGCCRSIYRASWYVRHSKRAYVRVPNDIRLCREKKEKSVNDGQTQVARWMWFAFRHEPSIDIFLVVFYLTYVCTLDTRVQRGGILYSLQGRVFEPPEATSLPFGRSRPPPLTRLLPQQDKTRQDIHDGRRPQTQLNGSTDSCLRSFPPRHHDTILPMATSAAKHRYLSFFYQTRPHLASPRVGCNTIPYHPEPYPTGNATK